MYTKDRKILGGTGTCRENNLEEEGPAMRGCGETAGKRALLRVPPPTFPSRMGRGPGCWAEEARNRVQAAEATLLDAQSGEDGKLDVACSSHSKTKSPFVLLLASAAHLPGFSNRQG